MNEVGFISIPIWIVLPVVVIVVVLGWKLAKMIWAVFSD